MVSDCCRDLCFLIVDCCRDPISLLLTELWVIFFSKDCVFVITYLFMLRILCAPRSEERVHPHCGWCWRLFASGLYCCPDWIQVLALYLPAYIHNCEHTNTKSCRENNEWKYRALRSIKMCNNMLEVHFLLECNNKMLEATLPARV